MKRTFLLTSICILTSLSATIAFGDLIITEAVYDVCNASATLNDGSGGNNGEYVIITNNGDTAVDVEGFELDDDMDLTDGDGMIIITGGTFNIAANSFLVFAGTDQTQWETEYGTLIAGAQFYNINDAMLSWQALNNNSGDDISFGNGTTNATNTGVGYTDVAADGETIIWDANTGAFVNGGIVSTNPAHGGQTYVPGTLSAATANIPEPTSFAILGLAGLLGLARRRKW